MTLTRKVTKVAAAAATAKDILHSDPKIVSSGEDKRRDDKNLESKDRDKAIVEWIGRPLKPPSSNEDEEDEDEEEDVGAALSSTEYGSPFDEDDEGHEDDRDDNGVYDCEKTVLYDA